MPLRSFEHLGRAEAAVHQVAIERVHFHEVGAADFIADIVGACVALELLGIDEISCSPFNVGVPARLKPSTGRSRSQLLQLRSCSKTSPYTREARASN